MTPITPSTVLDFWFGKPQETSDYLNERTKFWFMGGESLDATLRERFSGLLDEVAAGRRADWLGHPAGLVASIVVLDQFSRNIYRGTPRAFAQDPLALKWALQTVDNQSDRQLPHVHRLFVYLPFEHSEDLTMQDRSVRCFTQLLTEVPPELNEEYASNLDYAVRHRDVVRRFGRFPHRNKILGRASTPEETAFLQTPGSSF